MGDLRDGQLVLVMMLQEVVTRLNVLHSDLQIIKTLVGADNIAEPLPDANALTRVIENFVGDEDGET